MTVEFDPTSYTVSESGGFANITVVKRGQSAIAVSVNFATASGSATGEDQLLSMPLTLHWGAATGPTGLLTAKALAHLNLFVYIQRPLQSHIPQHWIL